PVQREPAQRKRQTALRPLEREHEDREHRAVHEQHEQSENEGQRPEARSASFPHSSLRISTSRVKPQMIISTTASRMTALAAARGNCRYEVCTWMILPTEAICWPPMTPMVTKSPITMVMTKIEPMRMPVRDSGTTTFHSAC